MSLIDIWLWRFQVIIWPLRVSTSLPGQMWTHFLHYKTLPPLVFPITINGVPVLFLSSQHPVTYFPLFHSIAFHMESFSKFCGILLLNLFSFIHIYQQCPNSGPTVCLLDLYTSWLNPLPPLLIPLLSIVPTIAKLFLHCINQYMLLNCLKPFVDLYFHIEML